MYDYYIWMIICIIHNIIFVIVHEFVECVFLEVEIHKVANKPKSFMHLKMNFAFKSTHILSNLDWNNILYYELYYKIRWLRATMTVLFVLLTYPIMDI